MADEIQVAVLRGTVATWNAWRSENTEAAIDLSGAGLRGLDLTDANLAEADLSGADLRGTILRQAVLSGANLTGANLFKAQLTDADLSGARINRVQFLNCAQLIAARNWKLAVRDPDLECGAEIPGED